MTWRIHSALPRRFIKENFMPHRINALPIAALLGTLALSACDGDRTTAPVALSDPVHAIIVPPALLDALGDARERVLPTVDADIQTPLGIALAELQSALDAGQLARSQRAIAAVRALLAAHTDTPDGDSADLASIGVLLSVADEAVR